MNLSNHARGDCFNPYRDRFNLQTSKEEEEDKLGGRTM